MAYIKKILFRLKFVTKISEKGFLSPNIRTQLILYYFFKFFFGLNKNCKFPVNFTSIVIMPERIKLGKNVWKSFLLSGNCYIQGINGIEIGDNTIFAPGVKIISADHNLIKLNEHKFCEPIKIGKNCWLGANSIILPGVELADNIVVAAGAVVTKSFYEKNIVIGGVPARIIKRIL
ncbi:acyltransferase [Melioribacter roseus]|uniref:acyltransferase n=1 Tax=Melioribacter roseus TaxID=1134405 RepID=UPI00068847E7|nr:acyltransferase [Melioribacter roseus]